MQCPKCKTFLTGVNVKCPICGYILTNTIDEKKEEKSNGLLDPRDIQNYSNNLDLYKKKNKEPNIIVPIAFILIVLIILLIFAIAKVL